LAKAFQEKCGKYQKKKKKTEMIAEHWIKIYDSV